MRISAKKCLVYKHLPNFACENVCGCTSFRSVWDVGKLRRSPLRQSNFKPSYNEQKTEKGICPIENEV